ncbi:MAG TPA: ABC transporter substrate-binding protein [Longimicrobiaceae bacterium]|nr:ABC transporter substrate-binding protein [Longimicrobiaceae bacterium]
MPIAARSRALLAAAFLAASAACAREPQPVVIGAIGPWSLDYGASARRGMELAAEQVNRAGGVGGRPLRIDFRDDGADASRAVRLVSDFADDRSVSAVIGPLNSGPLVAAARVADGRIVALSPTAASPQLNGISPWVFRLISNDSVFGMTLGRHAAHLGRKAAVLYDNNAFGRGGADAFRRNFGGQIVSVDPLWPVAPRPRAFVEWFRRQGVDLVYVAGLTSSGQAVLGEARRQGFSGKVLGTDSWTPLAREGRVAEGVYIATRFSVLEPRPEVAAFDAAYRTRWRGEPDGFAGFGYDAVQILSRAAAQAGGSRASLRDWLRSMPEHAGVTGPIRFTPGGEPRATRFVLLQVRDGRLALVDET